MTAEHPIRHQLGNRIDQHVRARGHNKLLPFPSQIRRRVLAGVRIVPDRQARRGIH